MFLKLETRINFSGVTCNIYVIATPLIILGVLTKLWIRLNDQRLDLEAGLRVQLFVKGRFTFKNV